MCSRYATPIAWLPDDLSPAGIERAELLARMLAESGIRTAYCSTRPVATHDGAIEGVAGAEAGDRGGSPTARRPDGHVQETVTRAKALPADAVAAVVGHSNTVGPIIKGLTGREIAKIEEHEFDKLFVLSIPGTGTGTATVAPMRYGKAS